MIIQKKTLFTYFLMAELLIIPCYYIFNQQGFRLVWYLNKEWHVLFEEINKLHYDVSQLQVMIDRWKTTPFYKEKLAREQLQMAYCDDIIFYLPEGN